MTILERKHFHFIGIGGIGTSSLAQILHDKGKKISGSDNSFSEITRNLQKKGIKVFNEHKADNISNKHQLIIYSPAIPSNNPELQKARRLKIKCLSYPQALGELTREYYTIAITGTHGKSTTTAMTALIATNAGLDPTVVIGTKLREFKNQNYRIGKSKYLVIEACEYKRSFLNFQPKILIITNIEAEHLDYYKDLKDYQKAFEEMVKKIPRDGYIIINSDDKNVVSVIKKAKAKIISWHATKSCLPAGRSRNNADYKLQKNILISNNNPKVRIHLTPGISGEFNVKNAVNAAIIGTILQVDPHLISKSIKAYKGSWRRLEYKKKRLGKTQFIDDYGHHPTEVRLTLAAIREKHPDSKILCVFQPHQYSRTKHLLKEFAHAFNNIDELIIPNIYRVRDSEEDVKSISVDALVAVIKEHQQKARNGHGFEKTAKFIKKNHNKFDIIVTMGAGDISGIYKLL